MSKEFLPLYNRIKSNLANKSAQDKFVSELTEIFHQNHTILSAAGLYQRPLLSNTPIYQLTSGIESEYTSVMELSTDMKPVAKSFKSESFYLRLILAAKYYLETKNEKMLNAVLAYTVLKLYSLLYLTYFTHGSAKVEVMDYTVNNLSNKYDIKRLGTLQRALSKLSESVLENYKPRLLSNVDNDMFEYMEGFRTRVNSFIKNVYDEFKHNYTHNLYMKVDSSTATGEEGEFEIERETRSNTIARFAQNFRLWFTSAAINKKGLRLAHEFEPLASESNLMRLIEIVKEDNSDHLEFVVAGMLGAVLEKNGTSDTRIMCSDQFVAFAISTFNKINITDSNIVSIRDGLEYFIRLQYGDDVKESVNLRYRKALLLYMTFSIQEFQCS
jgi:hypothetical protein